MENIDDIRKIFEQYLQDNEVVEYITQKQVFPKDNAIVFMILTLFSCCILGLMVFTNRTFTEMLFPFIFLIVFLSFVRISIKNPYLFFVPNYYCITDKRVLSYSPKFGIFNQCSLDMVYHVNKTGLHDITFTNKCHFIVFEFKDITDTQELCEFMKGKINK